LPHQQNRAIRKNRKQHDGATMGDDVPRDFDAARLDDAILPHTEHLAFIKDVAVENFCSGSRHGQRSLAQDRFDGEIPRSRCSLGTAILVGLPILRSVRGKCQTAEVDFAERERADQPAVICGAHPGKLKQKLRCPFGKGSAARYRAQDEG
jgi:hypothetical protein